MRRLRDPETGCAWDLEQNFKSIAPYAIEEAYEVVDAIEREDLHDLKDELGDLLLQVVFHSQMASELGEFEFDDVVTGIVDKMIRRHPHVFGDQTFTNAAEVKASWEAIKTKERAEKKARLAKQGIDDTAPSSALDGIANSLPALKRADKIQKRAARVGFDWPDVAPVFDKINEEVDEVKDAVEQANASAIEDELGDLLFTVVNLTRHYGVDAERALAKANDKFSSRFKQVEQLAQHHGAELNALSLEELDALWDEAKVIQKMDV